MTFELSKPVSTVIIGRLDQNLWNLEFSSYVQIFIRFEYALWMDLTSKRRKIAILMCLKSLILMKTGQIEVQSGTAMVKNPSCTSRQQQSKPKFLLDRICSISSIYKSDKGKSLNYDFTKFFLAFHQTIRYSELDSRCNLIVLLLISTLENKDARNWQTTKIRI